MKRAELDAMCLGIFIGLAIVMMSVFIAMVISGDWSRVICQ